MVKIPAISSILSPKHLALFVAKNFNFTTNLTCSVLKTGINHSYLICADEEKYVLRIYFKDWRTEDEIKEELKLLVYLKEHISVSYPIQNKEGKYLQKINAPEGERFGVLFSFAGGETIRVPSPKVCYNLGKAIAKMHLLTVDKVIERKNYSAKTLVSWAHEKAKTHFTVSSKEMDYFESATQIITTKFNEIDLKDVRKGIVHLDLWHQNMNVKNESEFTFFDFDNCGNGWLFLDVAYTLMLIFRNEPNKDDFSSKSTAFYKGYNTIATITKEEKALIPYGGLAIWLHYTGVHIERFNDFSNHFLNNEFLKYWIHTVEQWMKFNDIEI